MTIQEEFTTIEILNELKKYKDPKDQEIVNKVINFVEYYSDHQDQDQKK